MVREDVDWRMIGVVSASVILASRGVWESYTLFIRSQGSPDSIMFSLLMMVSVSAIMFVVGKAVINQKKIGWQTGLTTVLVLFTTDIMFTAFGQSQPWIEFAADSYLLIYFIVNRPIFYHGEYRTFRQIIDIAK